MSTMARRPLVVGSGKSARKCNTTKSKRELLNTYTATITVIIIAIMIMIIIFGDSGDQRSPSLLL